MTTPKDMDRREKIRVNEGLPLNDRARPSAIASWLALAGVLLVFAILVAWHIDLPGLYMDAVNPDYLVINLIHGNPDGNPAWVLPGNFVLGRLALLTQAYHGTFTVWLALPLTLLFGPSVAILRASQALGGAAILVCMFVFLRRERSKSSIGFVALPILALALDPVFVYSFRTQFYITLIPVAWLLAGMLCAERAFQRNPPIDAPEAIARHRSKWLFVAGLCTGLAVFGYFVFGFFLPALALGLAIMCARAKPAMTRVEMLRAFAWAGLGLFVGVLGYVIGYFRVMQAEHGPAGFAAWFSGYEHAVGAFDAHPSLLATAKFFAGLVWRVFSNDWQHSLMFGEGWPEPWSALKIALLMVLPAGIWAWRELRGTGSWRLRLVLGSILSFLTVAMAFGDRLAGHHFIALLPLSYLALGVALTGPAESGYRTRVAGIVALTPWILMIAINLAGLYATGSVLLRTHGRGMFSDTIDRYAEDALALRNAGKQQHVYMPDWGVFLSFHYLTDGKIAHSTDIDVDSMRTELCGAQDVAVVLIKDDVVARFAALTKRLGWTAPIEQTYRDHEGHAVFDVGTYRASDRGPAQEPICDESKKRQ